MLSELVGALLVGALLVGALVLGELDGAATGLFMLFGTKAGFKLIIPV